MTDPQIAWNVLMLLVFLSFCAGVFIGVKLEQITSAVENGSVKWGSHEYIR